MKLVATYNWDIEYSASGSETLAIEYPSAEQFLCDFEEWAEGTEERNSDLFYGIPSDAYVDRGNCSGLIIQTLEEWFDKNKEN